MDHFHPRFSLRAHNSAQLGILEIPPTEATTHLLMPSTGTKREYEAITELLSRGIAKT
jgi:hypothetical protein